MVSVPESFISYYFGGKAKTNYEIIEDKFKVVRTILVKFHGQLDKNGSHIYTSTYIIKHIYEKYIFHIYIYFF